jgi:hypothetical protein
MSRLSLRFRVSLARRLAGGSLAFGALLLAPLAVAQFSYEVELRSRAQLFPDAPAGITALRSRPVGDSRHYYVLTARGTTVLIYDAAGNRVGQIPAQPPATPAAAPFQYGDDLDVACPTYTGDEPPADGPPCYLYIADRGANALKMLSLDGKLVRSIPVQGPTSIAALAEGEVAVATMRSPRLITVFDRNNKIAREFAHPIDIASSEEFNRFLNIGRLASDAASNIYYAFTYIPEPTVKKFDRFGFGGMEIEMRGLDFAPAASAARREISRADKPGARNARLNLAISAIGVDPETQEVWLAIGRQLLHFTTDGTRLGTYRLFTAAGARVDATAILVEPNRLLVASETLGVFEFPRPDKAKR